MIFKSKYRVLHMIKIYNFQIPCYLLSVLASVSHILPPDGGDRLSLGITTFLSFTVFGLVVVENVPEESDDTPLFSEYQCNS